MRDHKPKSSFNISDLAKELECPECKKVMMDLFKQVRADFTSGQMPRIQLTKLISFIPRFGYARHKLNSYIDWWENADPEDDRRERIKTVTIPKLIKALKNGKSRNYSPRINGSEHTLRLLGILDALDGEAEFVFRSEKKD